MLSALFVFFFIFSLGSAEKCIQGENCHLPDCFCPLVTKPFNHPHFANVKDIPQMVYFGFDDALNVQLDTFYRQLFDSSHKNPNGCPITMSLYVQNQWTSYGLVESYYKKGMEIASHSVTHTDIDTADKLRREAGEQKDNLANLGHVPLNEIVGWRSPNLKTAGDPEPDVLKSLGYTYDISLTYTRSRPDDPIPWPYTLDYGYPYPCAVRPCPGANSKHPGFWEIPVSTYYDSESHRPCAYVDSCRPSSEKAAFDYLWSNFEKVYNGNRAPFGLNMHAAWFEFPEGYYNATQTFIERLLQLGDVYIITAKQVLDWMRNPVKVSEVNKLPEWGCKNPVQQNPQPANSGHSVNHIAARPPSSVYSPWLQRFGPSAVIPPTITRRPPTVTRRPPTITRRPPTVTRRPPTITRRPPTITRRPPTVTDRPPTVIRLPAIVPHRPSSLPFHPPTSFIPQPSSSNSQGSPARINQGNPSSTRGISPSHSSPILITFSRHTITPAPHRNINQHVNSHNENPVSGVDNDLRGVHADTCVQGVTCHLPTCQCRSFLPPATLSIQNTPQFVIFTIQPGSINGAHYGVTTNINSLFSPARANPNGCPMTATLFVPPTGHYQPFLQDLRNSGHEVAMLGGNLNNPQQVLYEMDVFKGLTGAMNVGFRNRAEGRLDENLLKALSENHVLYDSSRVMSRRAPFDDVIEWPYTLDYGINGCSTDVPGCTRYPGLWEVPVVPVGDYMGQYPCASADSCYNRPRTAQDTFDFLLKNLYHAMGTNRAPLRINLHADWFANSFYSDNLRGLKMFLEELHTIFGKAVYVTSVEKMLDWMKNPTGLDQIESFEPLKC